MIASTAIRAAIDELENSVSSRIITLALIMHAKFGLTELDSDYEWEGIIEEFLDSTGEIQ